LYPLPRGRRRVAGVSKEKKKIRKKKKKNKESRVREEKEKKNLTLVKQNDTCQSERREVMLTLD
jgi:hypothetical protein